FTSAAEHRLLMRADNADERLSELGHALGLLSMDRVERVRAKVAALEAEERRLARVLVSMPAGADAPAWPSVDGGTGGPSASPATRPRSALEVLARPHGSIRALRTLGVRCSLPEEWAACLEVRVRYRGYIERQERTAAQMAALERM